jgi:hypothetical protein
MLLIATPELFPQHLSIDASLLLHGAHGTTLDCLERRRLTQGALY